MSLDHSYQSHFANITVFQDSHARLSRVEVQHF